MQIPLIGECYVVEHNEITADQLHLKVKRVSRVMAELVADLVKSFYTNKFSEVVMNCPVPVFSIGAEKLNTDIEVLNKACSTVKAGARGIIFGRNIFMAKNPKNLIGALNDVMNNNILPEDAVKKYKL